jgi:hypothetical protein
MQRLLVIFLCTVLCSKLPAQLIVGWSGGYGNPQELNRVLYIYNAVNRQGLSKEMQPVHWNQGFAGGYRLGGELFFELLYSRKRILVHSEFDSSGVAFERQLKVLSNTWNFAMGYQDEHAAIGLSIDFGRFKGLGRRGPTAGIDDQTFEKLWVLDKTRFLGISGYKLYTSVTAFAELKYGIIALRAYVQYALMRNQMERLDTWLLGSQLNFAEFEHDKYSNAGLMVSIQIGGKK